MCTLAIYFQVFPDYPVVIAANRDEYLARPALPPTTLLEHPHVVGGKDLQASGTWLGINQYGLVAGLLNRRRTDYGDPEPGVALARPAMPRRAAASQRRRGGGVRERPAWRGLQRVQPADRHARGSVRRLQSRRRTRSREPHTGNASADQRRPERFRVSADKPRPYSRFASLARRRTSLATRWPIARSSRICWPITRPNSTRATGTAELALSASRRLRHALIELDFPSDATSRASSISSLPGHRAERP